MSPTRTLMVPMDGSGRSRLALLAADELTDRIEDLQIEVLSAVVAPAQVPRREAELAWINRRRARRVRVSVVVDSDPVGAISGHVLRLDNATVCMATRGRGRSAAVLGSVAERVALATARPLIVVGPLLGRRPAGMWFEDDIASLRPFRGGGVVVCVDNAAAAQDLVAVALHWAQALREPLIVLSVVEIAPLLSDRPFFPDRREPINDLRALLDSVVGSVSGEGVEVRVMAVEDPVSPAEGVWSYLERHPPALLAVSSQGRRRVRRLVFGSTAAAIVRSSTSPVLVLARPDLLSDERGLGPATMRAPER